MNAISEQIIEILVKDFSVDPNGITPATRFEDLDFDSLVLVELAVVLNGRFGVDVTEDDLFDRASVASAATLVETRLATYPPGLGRPGHSAPGQPPSPRTRPEPAR